MVWLMMAIISVAAYPIALILDRLLGQELGTIYSTPELKKLVDIHAKHKGTKMDTRTAKIMKGALDLQQTVIRDVMTKIDDVFFLPSDSKLTFDVLTNIFKSGHSRIPIMKKSLKTNSSTIVGILYSKDLVLLDPDDEIPVLRVMNAFRYKKPIFLNASTLLDQCLKIFVHSQQHLCMVKEDVVKKSPKKSPAGHADFGRDMSKSGSTENHEVLLDISDIENPANRTSHFDEYLRTYHHNQGVPSREEDIIPPVIIGIVTLEDVIEHALQTELVDEHDVFMTSKHGKLTSRMKRVDWSMLQLFDHRQKVLTSLPPQELQAVYHFLGQSVKAFMPKHRKCTESSIKNLLVSSSVIKIDNINIGKGDGGQGKDIGRLRDPYKDVEDHGLLLYQRDKKTEYFSLILDGKCEIYAGKQGFRSVLSRWTYLCPDALFQVQQCVLTGKPLMDYVPDFTCKVVENGRVLRIKLSDFKACVQGKFDGENNDFRPTIPPRGFSEPMLSPSKIVSESELTQLELNDAEPDQKMDTVDSEKEQLRYSKNSNQRT